MDWYPLWNSLRTAALACGAVFLLALGPDNFLLPALCATVAVLLLARPVLNRKKEAA